MFQNSEAGISLCLINYTGETYMCIQSTNMWWPWKYHNWVDHYQKSLFKNVYIKLFRASDLGYQWNCTLCCRRVHRINEEMSNLVADFQDRAYIFLVVSSSCLSFLSQHYFWVLGSWVRDLQRHRKRKLRVMTAVTTTARTTQAGDFITM